MHIKADTCCDELCHVSGLVYPQQYLCRFSAFLTTLSVTNGLQHRPLLRRPDDDHANVHRFVIVIIFLRVDSSSNILVLVHREHILLTKQRKRCNVLTFLKVPKGAYTNHGDSHFTNKAYLVKLSTKVGGGWVNKVQKRVHIVCVCPLKNLVLN